MTGVVSINHYTRLLALLQCLICLILFQDCAFNKLQSNSALRVSFQGNMGVWGNKNKCSRWYSSSIEINAVDQWRLRLFFFNIWPNLYCHGSFEGYCEDIPQGVVRVELWVGKCIDQTLGNANTGWNSVSRIMIEEVSRPES